MENLWMFASSMFYAVAGMIFFYVLALEPGLFHLGLLGAMSIVSAYGTLKKRKWVLWFVVAFFTVGTGFASITLYYSVINYGFFPNMEVGLLNVALVVYVMLTWVFSIYVMARRRKLEH